MRLYEGLNYFFFYIELRFLATILVVLFVRNPNTNY